MGGYKASSEKPEEPFAGRKSHGDCRETLLFNPVPVSHDADGLLLLTFCVPVLKARFHRFPVLPVSANPLCLECRAAAILKTRFKSSFPPASGFHRFRPFRFVLNEELPPFSKTVLKVHFHRFPILPVPAIPLCLECSAAAIPQTRFKGQSHRFPVFTRSGRSALS